MFDNYASVAQLVEHLTFNQMVGGSSPLRGMNLHKGCLGIHCPICRWQMPKEMLKGLRISYSNKNSKFGKTVVAEWQTLEDLVLPAHESVQVQILSTVV